MKLGVRREVTTSRGRGRGCDSPAAGRERVLRCKNNRSLAGKLF